MSADDLQTSLWNYVKGGDRTVYRQHTDTPAGEWLEIMAWPFPTTATLTIPGEVAKAREVELPGGTVFMGVQWLDDAWRDVKAGLLTGYSLAGLGRGVVGEVPL